MSQRLVRVLSLLALVALAVAFLYRVRTALTPFVLAVILAYLLAPAVDFLGRRRLSRLVAIIVVYLLLFVAIGSFFVYLIPSLVGELERLAQNLPLYTAQVRGLVEYYQLRYRHAVLPEPVRQVIDESVASVGSSLLGLVRRIVAGILSFAPQLVNVVLAPVLAFYFLLDWNAIGGRLMAALPARRRPAILAATADMDRMLGGYVRSEIIVAALVGGLSGLAMLILGLRFAVVFGVISAIGELVPYFGPFLAALPPVALALLRSPALAVKVAIAYVIIQQIEGNIIAPKIVGDHVGLHPLVVIFALLAGGSLAGVPGMLLAVPAAGVLKILGSHIARHWMETGPEP
ncbi:MAG: AI-2E family transporter [Chloroflexota bacterium]